MTYPGAGQPCLDFWQLLGLQNDHQDCAFPTANSNCCCLAAWLLLSLPSPPSPLLGRHTQLLNHSLPLTALTHSPGSPSLLLRVTSTRSPLPEENSAWKGLLLLLLLLLAVVACC